ncbi:MAG: tetratricopeptide repeat protein [Thermoguttaceae bacterium]
MKRISAKFWTACFVLLVLGAADLAGLICRPASAQQSNAASGDSWYTPITSGVKRGFNKIGEALDPNASKTATPEDDAISLKSKSKPSPELYVAIGRLYEESGKLPDAEHQYQAALKMCPDHLAALLAYARLKEQLEQKNEALQLYQQAAKTHPREPSVYNNIGLFYARQGRLDEAVSAMSAAIQMAPKNPLYRNNIATVLVDQCRFREAFTNLRAVHGEAAAYYNLGYLLNKKGQTQAAMQHFAMALRADPSLVSAQRWIEYLEKKTTQTRLAHHPTAEGLRITSEKSQPEAMPDPGRPDSSPNEAERNRTGDLAGPDRDASSMLPDAVRPRRLPPVPSGQPEAGGPSLPGISYDRGERPAIPTAPLPPPSTNSAVRRLPQVN